MVLAMVVGDVEALAADLPDSHEEWVIMPTPHDDATLVQRVEDAIAAVPLDKATAASVTVGSTNLGRTVGMFAPQIEVRMLTASVAAAIEAPVRLYLTENSDRTAILSYKTAAHVFGPDADGGEDLEDLAVEIDAILATIAEHTSAC